MTFKNLVAAVLLALAPTLALGAQATHQMPTAGPMSFSTFLSTYLNPSLAAIVSNNSGSTAPAVSGQPVTYQFWVDTSGSPRLLKLYDGASWLTIASIDTSGHLLAINSSQLSGLSTGMLTFLQTASSANLRGTLTDETGTGLDYFQGGDLGTPSAGVGTHLTGIPISTGISGMGTNVAALLATFSSANLRAALTDETGTGFDYFQGGDLGTPSAGVLTNATGLPVNSGISGMGTNVAALLATFSSANLRAALTDETGTGFDYFQGGDLGTPSAGVLTNATGLPVGTGISGMGTNVASLLATFSSANLRAALTDETGTGFDYFQGGDLGTPSAGVGTNFTGIPIVGGTTGTLSVARGGTGQTTAVAARGALGLNIFGRSTFADANYTVLATDRTVDTTTSFTAARTATLPAASAVSPDDPVDVRDHAGAINGSNTLTIAAAGSDTINGASSLVISTQYGGLVFKSDGVSSWHAVVASGGGGGSGVTGVTAGSGLSGGTITTTGTIAVAANGVTSSMLATMAAHTYKGNNSGSTATPTDVSAANLGADLAGLVAAPDQDRRNALLNCASTAKALAGYQRLLETFCDGYKASDGVNSGSSSNATVNTTSGYVGPTVTTDTYSTTAGPITLGSSGGGFSGYGIRTRIPASAVSTNGDRVRITLHPSAAANTVIGDCFIGQAGSGSSFGSTPTRCTFGGSNGITLTAGAADVVSDNITFSVDETKDILIAWGITGASNVAYNPSQSGWNSYQKSGGSGETATVSTTGYTTNTDTPFLVDLVEVRTATGGTQNMTLVTTTQTADATVTSGRALAEIDPVDAITLNTNLNASVTCDSGSHWTSATLSSIGKGQGGRTVVETADTACGTSGTGFAAKWVTSSNKMVNLYKSTVTVH